MRRTLRLSVALVGATTAAACGTPVVTTSTPVVVARPEATLDLTDIMPVADRTGIDVLNGIAYDSKGDRLFVTGKWWPQWAHTRRLATISSSR